MTNLDEYVIENNDDKEIIEQLAKLGIKPLKDLSAEAQLLKQRRWERELAAGRRRRTTTGRTKNGQR